MLPDMRKTLTLTLAVALFGILAAVVVAQVGQDPATPAGTTTEGTTTEDRTTTTETTEDREDRDDDRGRDDDRVRGDDDGPGDISGPCDEAEHANDPRCAGVTVPAAAGAGSAAGPANGRRRHLRPLRRGRARERPALHRRRRRPCG